MLVRELMTTEVRSCGPDSNLAEVAASMWDADCGIVPVVNSEGRVVSVVTDRDICIAAGTRGRAPNEIPVGEVVASGEVFSCQPDDDVRDALRTMGRRRVRRLPVLDEGGRLRGLFSINDAVLRAGTGAGTVSAPAVLETLKAICAHRPRDGAAA